MMVMWICRSRWFRFLRRIFDYHQTGARLTDSSPSNPFNCGVMVAMELLVLAVQMIAITVVVFISRKEKPFYPLRVWIVGYFLGKLVEFPLLYWRFWISDAPDLLDLESTSENNDHNHLVGVFFDVFFAIWFVIGNIWVFDSRSGSFEKAPKLQYLCISILTWNALVYSIPFLLFILLICCCCINIPFISITGSVDRGASEDQITCLLKSGPRNHPNPEECCICPSNYVEEDELRQLPCSNLFHLRCVDQWLRIISCCPLCKQQLER
ncbi:hypothetical protein ZOSMA_144G00120 [Zostera marina]|uniref:RING-type domain-containing protein n=1 Tax=Zostera marina TaxID=29655 RepID=A0A0K9PZK6_ZOSMR|nr:hypothetical protein ZOSMA_144G00120 [Zostera marina]